MRYGEIQKQKWKLMVLTCKFLHKVIAQNEELAISQRQHKNWSIPAVFRLRESAVFFSSWYATI